MQEESFTQRVRSLYMQKMKNYEETKADLYRRQCWLVQQLYLAGRITTLQYTEYCQLFARLDRLSFVEMVATRAQVVPRTIQRTIFETRFDQVAEWPTITSILQAIGVDQNEIWELNLLYLFERAQGVQKKTRVTTQSPAIVSPRTEPFGPVDLPEKAKSLLYSE